MVVAVSFAMVFLPWLNSSSYLKNNWRTHYYVRSTESIKENDVSTKTLHELVDLAMPWETFSHHGCSNWSVGLQLRSSCMYHDQSCVISHLLSKIP